jgi:TniQ
MPLSGKLWPFHLKPKDDELLSSWLVRLSRANSVKVHTLCSSAWPDKSVWNRDIDKSADDEIIKILAEKTGTSYDRAFQTTLRAYEGFVYEKHNPSGNTPWIMPVGVYHRTRRRYGLQYCPECLSEDKEPYFRRRWRLAFITICEKHCTLLRDRCPKCGAPVSYHRVRIDAASVTLCSKCGFDLRQAKPMIVDCFGQLYLQHKLLKAVKDGYVLLPGRIPVYSHLYFAVLHQVLKLLVTREKAHKLCRQVRKYVSIGMPQQFLGRHRGFHYIEVLDVRNRYKLLTMASWLLDDWPYRFVTLCKKIPLLSFDLLKDMRNVPYWYWHVVFENLYEPDWQPSKAEIIAAINYLKKGSQKVYKQWVAELMGVSLDLRKRTDIKRLFRKHGRFHLAA